MCKYIYLLVDKHTSTSFTFLGDALWLSKTLTPDTVVVLTALLYEKSAVAFVCIMGSIGMLTCTPLTSGAVKYFSVFGIFKKGKHCNAISMAVHTVMLLCAVTIIYTIFMAITGAPRITGVAPFAFIIFISTIIAVLFNILGIVLFIVLHARCLLRSCANAENDGGFNYALNMKRLKSDIYWHHQTIDEKIKNTLN
ncbi:MAG: hypothetical protein ACI9TY_000331 [Alphaproteobacteria bacterium]